MACQAGQQKPSRNAVSGCGPKSVLPMGGGPDLLDGERVMSDRAEFEKWFDGEFDPDKELFAEDKESHWQAWQAARAQNGQGAEPVALLRREIGESSWFDHTPVMPNTAEAEGLKASTEMDYCKVYTHPQPAQQGSVPEGWLAEFARRMDEQLEKAHDMSGFGPIILHIAQEVIADTPQPEGDGWVKCSERLPTEADADFEYRLWCWLPERKDMKLLLLDQVIQAHLQGCAVLWAPTGLKRPQPPVEQGEGS